MEYSWKTLTYIKLKMDIVCARSVSSTSPLLLNGFYVQVCLLQILYIIQTDFAYSTGWMTNTPPTETLPLGNYNFVFQASEG